jgi:hypothetical protein
MHSFDDHFYDLCDRFDAASIEWAMQCIKEQPADLLNRSVARTLLSGRGAIERFPMVVALFEAFPSWEGNEWLDLYHRPRPIAYASRADLSAGAVIGAILAGEPFDFSSLAGPLRHEVINQLRRFAAEEHADKGYLALKYLMRWKADIQDAGLSWCLQHYRHSGVPEILEHLAMNLQYTPLFERLEEEFPDAELTNELKRGVLQLFNCRYALCNRRGAQDTARPKKRNPAFKVYVTLPVESRDPRGLRAFERKYRNDPRFLQAMREYVEMYPDAPSAFDMVENTLAAKDPSWGVPWLKQWCRTALPPDCLSAWIAILQAAPSEENLREAKEWLETVDRQDLYMPKNHASGLLERWYKDSVRRGERNTIVRANGVG